MKKCIFCGKEIDDDSVYCKHCGKNIPKVIFDDAYGYVTMDKYGVFYSEDCKRLVHAPDMLTGAFTIPSGTEIISNRAFYSCWGLTSVTIPDSVTSIGESAFEHCSSLTEFTIGSALKEISNKAFKGCIRLRKVTIPQGIERIGESAFEGCVGLEGITIPSSISIIKDRAFQGCNRLESITALSSDPPKTPNQYWGHVFAFAGVDTNTCILYVPKGSAHGYRTYYEWKYFNNIVELK